MAKVLPPPLLLLVLVILSSGSPSRRLVQAKDCTAGSTTVHRGRETVNDRPVKNGEAKHEMFVKAMRGFKGVSLEVHEGNGLKAAWFPKEDCFSHDGKWQQILTKTEIKDSKTTMTLRIAECWITCTINSSLSNPDSFSVVAYGPSSWLKETPEGDCEVKAYSRTDEKKYTCQEPRTSIIENLPDPESLTSIPVWAIIVAVVLAVIVVGAIVVYWKWKSETSRNAANPGELTEPNNAPHVINDVTYESFGNDTIEDHSPCEAFDNTTKDGPSLVQGEAPYTIENNQHESFSSYEHRYNQ
ncbi:uncharacterized protein LOC135099684 [Scylla paramamosain]|uniref:uncharacterized protein LOC135099684 n=1 Tax=Scylla paramamosain TaxID=85552 RepID=UPI003083686F